MRQNLILLLCFTICIAWSSCSNDKDTQKRAKSVVENYIRFKISGVWGDSDGRRVWGINQDSIYYYDNQKAKPYRLDSLYISVKSDNSDSFKYLGWIHVEKDTLIVTTMDSVLKMQRIR
jgi:hypothetical protein